MGLGGYLTWTAVARELVKNNKAKKLFPSEVNGNQYREVKSPIWLNNPYLSTDRQELIEKQAAVLPLNNREISYCKYDDAVRCVQRADKHCIEQMCDFYGLKDPEIKCDLFFSDEEHRDVDKIISGLSERLITIEPHSKKSYTPNKEYSFEKWQKIVNVLSKEIQIVQVGNKDMPILENVVNMVGSTTFRECAGVIGRSELFLSTEGGLAHASTAVNTTALIVMTGYQSPVLWSYPQNINVYIGNHGPCGFKILCKECVQDIHMHDESEIAEKAMEFLRGLE